jgi:hypothetical protein
MHRVNSFGADGEPAYTEEGRETMVADGTEDGEGDARMTNGKDVYDKVTGDPHAKTQNSLASARPSGENDPTMET